MSIGDLVSGLWSTITSSHEKIMAWAKLNLRMSRGVAGIFSTLALPGCGAAVSTYAWGIGKVNAIVSDPTAFLNAPVDMSRVNEAMGGVGASWLARANIVLPVQELCTMAVALIVFAGTCAVLKLVLAAIRDLVPTGG